MELYVFIDNDGLLKCLFENMPSNEKITTCSSTFHNIPIH